MYERYAPTLNPRQDESTLNNFLKFVSRGGYAVRDALGGNIQGAIRQGADVWGDTIDAFLPGDLIPEFSRKQDYMEASDLVGGMDDGFAKTAVDFIGGVALDPLTYVSFGAGPAAVAAKGGLKATAGLADDALRMGAQAAEVGSHLSKAGRKTLKANPSYVDDIVKNVEVPFTREESILRKMGGDNFEQGGMRMRVPFTDVGTKTFFQGKHIDPLAAVGRGASYIPGANAAGTFAKKTLGWDTPTAAGSSLLDEAGAVSTRTEEAAHGFLGSALKGVPPDAKEALVKAFHGVDNASGSYKALDDSALKTFETAEEQIIHLEQRLAQMGLSPESLNKAKQAGRDLIGHNLRDFQTSISSGGMKAPKMYTQGGERVLLDDIMEQVTTLKDDIKGGRVDLNGELREVTDLLRQGVISVDDAAGLRSGITTSLDDVAERLKQNPQEWADDLGYKLEDIPTDVSPSMYLHRMIDGADEAGEAFNKPRSFSSRKISDKESLADYLNSGKGTLNTSLEESVAARAAQQGRSQGKAFLGRAIAGDDFNLVDMGDDIVESLGNGMEHILKNDPALARNLESFMHGKGNRKPFMQVLADSNKLFKPFAVYGALIPKMGSIVRNKVGQVFQSASVEATRSGTLGQIKQSAGDLFQGIQEGYAGPTLNYINGVFAGALDQVGLKLKPNQLGDARKVIDDAFKNSNGQLDDAYRILGETHPELAEAARFGVLDGFVKSEDLVKEIGGLVEKSKTRKFFDKASGGSLDKAGETLFGRVFNKAFYAPGIMFNTVESNGRLGMFLHLRNQGVSPANAARSVQEAFLDYSITTAENRALRDIIPFAAFITGSVKQQSKLLSKHPGVGVAANQVYGQNDDPVYPWMADQAHIRMPWDDNEGNPVYSSGFGAPIEALNSIPNLFGGDAGRQVEQNIVGSSQPLLKTAYSAVTGRDPYFRSEFGSYAKDPLTHQESEFGKAYNVAAGTGLLQPVDSALRAIGKFTDSRKSFPVALLDSLTGVKIQSVDEDKARKQILRDFISKQSNTGTYSGFYAKDKSDTELTELIKALRKK